LLRARETEMMYLNIDEYSTGLLGW
jgi:hypothetical protein